MTRGGLRKDDILKKKITRTRSGERVTEYTYVPKKKSNGDAAYMKEHKTTLAYWRAAVKAVNDGEIPVPFPSKKTKEGKALHKKAMVEFRKYMNGEEKPSKKATPKKKAAKKSKTPAKKKTTKKKSKTLQKRRYKRRSRKPLQKRKR